MIKKKKAFHNNRGTESSEHTTILNVYVVAPKFLDIMKPKLTKLKRGKSRIMFREFNILSLSTWKNSSQKIIKDTDD